MMPGLPCGRTHEWKCRVCPESVDMLCVLYGIRLMKSNMHTAVYVERTNSLSFDSLTDPYQLQTKKQLRKMTIHEYTKHPWNWSRTDVYCERGKFERCHCSKIISGWLDDLRLTCWHALMCDSPDQNDDNAHPCSFRFRTKPLKQLFLREQEPLWEQASCSVEYVSDRPFLEVGVQWSERRRALIGNDMTLTWPCLLNGNVESVKFHFESIVQFRKT